MDSIVVVGGRKLRGEVEVSGSKNAALPAIAACLLAPGEHRYQNVPRLADIATMLEVLTTMGCRTHRRGTAVAVEVPGAVQPSAPYDLVKTMRASVLVLGPLVARHGKARVALPGGCAIGARPIDQHLKGLAALGAKIEMREGYVSASARRLHGARFTFDLVTVTGTENVMMAATLARGRTVLENAAREPEVQDLAAALNAMGAQVRGAGTDVITIDGVDELRPLRHRVIADRIEAGTLLAAAAVTGGDVRVRGVVAHHLDAVIQKFREAGCEVEVNEADVRIRGPERLDPVAIRTQEYPGFPTDMQAQFMAALSTARGTSVITENIFENRFMHVAELQRLGATIAVEGATAVVQGVPTLGGAEVMATDLRASACLVLAGLAAHGHTKVSRVYHLDRGYERLENKLRRLGAQIRRVKA